MTATQWLQKNQSRLSLRALEVEIGCAETTLYKAVKGTQALPKKWEQPVIDLAKKMAYIEEKTPE